MKKPMLTALLAGIVTTGAFAQGTITVDNIANTNQSLWATSGGLVFAWDFNTLLLGMDNEPFSLQLLGGANSYSMAPIVTLTGSNQVLGLGGGLFADPTGATYEVPGVPENGIATLEILAWEGNFTSLAAAQLGGYWGETVTFQNPTGGGGLPPATPADLTGMPALQMGYPPYGVVIVQYPQNQTNLAGTTATFTYLAYSNDPWGYQWLHNGTNLANASGAADTHWESITNTVTLSIPNVSDQDAGEYAIAVDVYEEPSSFIAAGATLTVIDPPKLAFQINSGMPTLTLNGALNYNFVVQYSDNVVGTNWVDLLSVTNLSSSPYRIIDPGAFSQTARFYRAIMR